MKVAGMIKYIRKEIHKKATEMRIRWKDIDMSERCVEKEFNVYGVEGDVLAEKV